MESSRNSQFRILRTGLETSLSCAIHGGLSGQGTLPCWALCWAVMARAGGSWCLERRKFYISFERFFLPHLPVFEISTNYLIRWIFSTLSSPSSCPFLTMRRRPVVASVVCYCGCCALQHRCRRRRYRAARRRRCALQGAARCCCCCCRRACCCAATSSLRLLRRTPPLSLPAGAGEDGLKKILI